MLRELRGGMKVFMGASRMSNIEDETAITEITIQPDGRIYVFGLSLEVAQALSGLCPPGHAIEPTGGQVQKAGGY